MTGKIISILSVLLLTTQTLTAQAALIDVNQWQYWQNVYGLCTSDSLNTAQGGAFNRNDLRYLVYADGLIWGGWAEGGNLGQPELRVGGVWYNSALQPGPMADKKDTTIANRVYRARRNLYILNDYQLQHETEDLSAQNEPLVTVDSIRHLYERDWAEWPADNGAPFYDRNRNGKWDPQQDEPGLAGADQLTWYVVNDADSAASINLYNCKPIGLEVQVTVWAYDQQAAALGQTVFKRYRLINRGPHTVRDMYLSIPSDPDVDSYSDDRSGCDSLQQYGYTYNARIIKDTFQMPRQDFAVAYILLQGPVIPQANKSALFDFQVKPGFINRPMTSFNYFGPNLVVELEWDSLAQYYNLIRGYAPTSDLTNPTPLVQLSGPHAGQPTFYPGSGDPVTDPYGHQGDLDIMQLGDRRMMVNSGPFTMAPGDTQEIVIAILAGVGDANSFSAVADLQRKVPFVHSFYQSLVNFTPPEGPIPKPDSQESLPVADTFELLPAFPNPFNGLTNFKIFVYEEMKLTCVLYDVLGRRMLTLHDGLLERGPHTLQWDGKTAAGAAAASGVYFLRIQNGPRMQWQKVVYLR